MTGFYDKLHELSNDYQQLFKRRQIIMSFESYLELLRQRPQALTRTASVYLKDCMSHFGGYEVRDGGMPFTRHKIFDTGTFKYGSIIGGERYQNRIYKIIENFARQGYSNKLILLHGPNGSAKTSTVETIARAMQQYSELEQGAVYRFNWVFPAEQSPEMRSKGESGPIGFSPRKALDQSMVSDTSYALLDDQNIASRIHSEFKENPFYLIPMPYREKWMKEWIAIEKGIDPSEVVLPPHVYLSGLSKRNQLIFETLLNAYDGDINKVFRHIQVERFFYSYQYRVGIASVEPQMVVDANEKQLTMDQNIANLPSVLHNISFHEVSGQLVDANRGILEFSDMLKRPLEALKYLLSTIEKSTVSLHTGTAHLDLVFFATTNEKHLDAFKASPDFTAFSGRFALVTVPYLLNVEDEQKIYKREVEILSQTTKIAPHSVELLSLWAVMTRMKQPDVEKYDIKERTLISRVDPLVKAKMYAGRSLQSHMANRDEKSLYKLRDKIVSESLDLVVYEGRFGASPRELKVILSNAAQNPNHSSLTPMAIFEELESLVKNRTIHEFLQFEPRGKYHDAALFIDYIKAEFAEIFANESLKAMNLVDDQEYETLLKRYIDHVVGSLKNEKVYDQKRGTSEEASTKVMSEIEKILDAPQPVEKFRRGLLSRIAASKIDNPNDEIVVSKIFEDFLQKIRDHYHGEKTQVVGKIYNAMLALGTNHESDFSRDDIAAAKMTYDNLEKKFGYTNEQAKACLQFYVTFQAEPEAKA